MQVLKYKFRMYPTESQEKELLQIIGSCRFVWNHFLAKEMERYESEKKFNFYNKNSIDLTQLKKTEEFNWLAKSPATALQDSVRILDQALKQSLPSKKGASRRGFPKFKKRKNFTGSFTLQMVNFKRNIKNGKFHVAKGLDVKFTQHRELPSDFASCQVKQESGKWFLVLTCKKAKTILASTGHQVGIDLNSKEYVLSNGTRYEIPKYLKENQFKIKKLQRGLASKTKGSKNRKKAQLKLAKVHWTVANQRSDYFHKLSTNLIREYDTIVLEDLDVAGIQRKFGHVVKDNGFAVFRNMIEYKAELYGRQVVVIDRYFPSSQICSGCGATKKIPLDVRTYDCDCCGMILDRDLNAAINLHRAGTAHCALGEDSMIDQYVIAGRLSDFNEEGSYVL